MESVTDTKASEMPPPEGESLDTKDDQPIQTEEDDEIVMSQIEYERWKLLNDEDVRMDGVILAESSMNDTFENRAYLHPHGMTYYDYPSIPKERREGLENYKMKVRHENYHYLHQHPELDSMMQLFLKKLLLVQPPDAIKFAAEFFSKKNKETRQALTREELDYQTKIINRYRSAHSKVKMPTVNSLLMKRPANLNSLQSLNIQPHAYDFKFEAEKRKEVTPPPEPPKEKHYCGCKDPGRKTVYQPHPFVSDVSRIMKSILLEEEEGEDGNLSMFPPPSVTVSHSKPFTPMSTTMDEDESTVEGSVNYEAGDEDEEF